MKEAIALGCFDQQDLVVLREGATRKNLEITSVQRSCTLSPILACLYWYAVIESAPALSLNCRNIPVGTYSRNAGRTKIRGFRKV